MLTEQQLIHFKNELINQKDSLIQNIENDEKTIESANARERELSMYDNHPADMGTELYERERDMALSIHNQTELRKINQALQAIESGTYGKCETCGKEIPFERLEALPFSTFCTEHAAEQVLPGDRPVEEEYLNPARSNSFSNRDKSDDILDYEDDSFEEVAKFGTSETPSDFVGDYNDYNELYHDDSTNGVTEEYEIFSATDITGNVREVIQSEAQEIYKEKLDEEGLESTLGDIPYKQSDGYVDDKDS